MSKPATMASFQEGQPGKGLEPADQADLFRISWESTGLCNFSIARLDIPGQALKTTVLLIRFK
jgi:hypothetical protein